MTRIEFPKLPDFNRRIDLTPENRMPESGEDFFLEIGVPVEIPQNKRVTTFQDIDYTVGHLDYPFYPESKE